MTIENDIIVIGAGFGGAFAAMQCEALGYKTCLLNHGLPMSSLFSGCFDFLDDELASGFDSPLGSHSLKKILDYLPTRKGQHIYSHLFNCALHLHKKNTHDSSEVFLFSSLIKEASRKFFKTFDLAANGNGDDYYYALTPSGILKPTAYALEGLGGFQTGFPLKGRVGIVEISGLKDYQGELIKSVLEKKSATKNLEIEVIHLELNCLRQEYLSSLTVASYLEEKENVMDLIQKLKPEIENFDLLVFPPVLGIKNEKGIKQIMAQEINIPFCEMISLLPSVPGMRVQGKINEKIMNKNILVDVNVTQIEEKSESILVRGVDLNNNICEKTARYVVLAGGKESLISDSSEHKGKHSLLNLDLFDGTDFRIKQGKPQLTTDDETNVQKLFKLGLKTDLNLNPHDEIRKYERVLICGHALAGFDFAVDRCGFGVSVLSAHLVVNILKNILL